MNTSRPAPVPQPAAGSIRAFALLYTPPEQRVAVRTLLALGDEIGAGLGRQLDHAVAHIRLEWWRIEVQRFAAGEPAHPWLIAWRHARTPALDLTPLVDAAAIDLASQRLAASASRRLAQALFVLAARVLTADAPQAALSGEQEEQIAALGRAVDELEHPAPSGNASPPIVPAPPAPAVPAPALQHALAPLLVWAALAARQARRRNQRNQHNRHNQHDRGEQHAPDNSPTMRGLAVDGIGNNVLAWRTARAARRGRFRWRICAGVKY